MPVVRVVLVAQYVYMVADLEEVVPFHIPQLLPGSLATLLLQRWLFVCLTKMTVKKKTNVVLTMTMTILLPLVRSFQLTFLLLQHVARVQHCVGRNFANRDYNDLSCNHPHLQF